MAFVWAERVESTNPKNAYDSAENVSLFEVKLDQLLSLFFHKLDGALNVHNGEAGRERYRLVEAIRRKSQVCVCLVQLRIQHHSS